MMKCRVTSSPSERRHIAKLSCADIKMAREITSAADAIGISIHDASVPSLGLLT